MKWPVTGIVVLLTAACTSEVSQNGAASGDIAPAAAIKSAAGVPQAQAAYSDSSMSPDVRIALLNSYADGVDGRLPSRSLPSGIAPLTEVSTPLADGVFADISDDHWSRMDAFYDGAQLKRLDMVPARTGQGLEVFYFEQGKLLMVARHADTTVTAGRPARMDGERFYFGQPGLVAWVHPDGTKADPSTDAFHHWSDKLLKESLRFPNGG